MLITDLCVEHVIHDWAELREGDAIAFPTPAELQDHQYVWALGDFDGDDCREYPIQVETSRPLTLHGHVITHDNYLSHYEGFVLLNARWDFSREVFVPRTGEPEPFIEIPVY